MIDRMNPWQTKTKKLRSLVTDLELADDPEEVERLIQSLRVTLREMEELNEQLNPSISDRDRS